MKLFAISDLHLSFDDRIGKPMAVFGRDWDDHAERLKEKWDELIGPEDIVIIPGDISWGLRLDEAAADLEWIGDRPGTKILIKGNHDPWWVTIGKLNREFGSEQMIFLQNKAWEVRGTGVYLCGTRGWVCPGPADFTEHDRKIYNREVGRLELSLKDAVSAGAREIIAALHYPPTNEMQQGSGFTTLLSSYGVRTCVYGHLHGKLNFARGMKGIYNGVEYKLVSLDYLKCTPLLLREF